MKKHISSLVVALIVVALGLAIGLTGAWFTASRTATGLLKLANGIELVYTGMEPDDPLDPTAYYLLMKDNSTANSPVAQQITELYPAAQIAVSQVTVKKSASSSNALLRYKLDYYYKASGDANFTQASGADDANLYIATNLSQALPFAHVGDYFYYTTTANASAMTSISYSDLQQVPANDATALNLFNNNLITLANNIPEGYQIKIQITIQAIQPSQDAFEDLWEADLPVAVSPVALTKGAVDYSASDLATIKSSGTKVGNNWQVGGETVFSIGDEFTFMFDEGGTNQQTVTMVLADINHDIDASNNTITFSFVMKYALNSDMDHRMNANYTNVGGWPLCEMKTWLNGDDVFGKLPEELQNAIIPAKKSTMLGGGSDGSPVTTVETCTTNLWLLSHREVNGKFSDSEPYSLEGSPYPIFTDKNSRIKYRSDGTTTAYYWLRSPSPTSNQQFGRIDWTGNTSYPETTNLASAVVFGFCI